MPLKSRTLSSTADFGPLLTCLVLSSIGVLLIYSSGKLEFSSIYGGLFKKQILWILVASVVLYFTMKVSTKILHSTSYLFYTISVILLVVVLALPASGPHRWIQLAGYQLQPSEVAKLFTILALARYLGGKRRHLERLADFIIPILIMGTPAILILIEPDLGTASVFIPVMFAMLYWAGARPLYLLFILSPLFSLVASSNTIFFTIFLIILVVVIQIRKPFFFDAVIVIATNITVGLLYKPLWNRLELYQKKRLLAFLGLESDPARYRLAERFSHR